jgi:hypothetical protein
MDLGMKAKWLMWIHGIKTIGWVVMIPISLLTSLKTSVPFVVFLSLWALVESSISAWQGARAELESSNNT